MWATRTLLEFCAALSPEQRQLTSPATYGAIDQTLAHAVGADEYYLYLLTGERPARPLEPNPTVDFADLIARAERNAGLIERLSSSQRDTSALTPVKRGEAPISVGMVLAQIVHHGNEHRAVRCARSLARTGSRHPMSAAGRMEGRRRPGDCRGERIRTSDSRLPKAVRYQAALHPVTALIMSALRAL